MIYFVEAIGSDRVKIGTAADVWARLQTIQACSPLPLRVVKVVDGSRREEVAFHERWRKHRSHGEWFALLPILREIEALEGAPSFVPGTLLAVRTNEARAWSCACGSWLPADRMATLRSKGRPLQCEGCATIARARGRRAWAEAGMRARGIDPAKVGACSDCGSTEHPLSKRRKLCATCAGNRHDLAVTASRKTGITLAASLAATFKMAALGMGAGDVR